MSKTAHAIYNPTTIEVRMEPARIAELLEPFLGPAKDQGSTSSDLIPNISTYIDILLRWNARINLTAIRDPDEIVTRHFGESLFAARHLFPNENREDGGLIAADSVSAAERRQNAAHGASRGSAVPLEQAAEQRKTHVADVGSGAGFPGIPIKLWAPHISLTLIESNHKKVAFLREATRALTLTDVNIQNARAETLPQSSFNVVTLRAVERFESILPTAAALVAPTGRLALLIGADQLDRVQAALTTHTLSSPIPIPLSRSRILLTALRPAGLGEPK